MTRPLRLEFPGALYHVAARGNNRHPIYRDEADRRAWMGILRDTCARYNAVIHAYCQMTNHFHLLIETHEPNLAHVMRYLNASYSQSFNRRHSAVGHLFQGRYKAILVQRDGYLLELARYIVLNPVRAGMVAAPGDWPWSSYHWMFRDDSSPPWLDVEQLLGHFAEEKEKARSAYHAFVIGGIGRASPLVEVRYQTILGDDWFIEAHRDGRGASTRGITRTQRRQAVPRLADFDARFPERDEAMARAYWTTAFTMAQIGAHFGVSHKTVSRAVQNYQAVLMDAAGGPAAAP